MRGCPPSCETLRVPAICRGFGVGTGRPRALVCLVTTARLLRPPRVPLRVRFSASAAEPASRRRTASTPRMRHRVRTCASPQLGRCNRCPRGRLDPPAAVRSANSGGTEFAAHDSFAAPSSSCRRPVDQRPVTSSHRSSLADSVPCHRLHCSSLSMPERCPRSRGGGADVAS